MGNTIITTITALADPVIGLVDLRRSQFTYFTLSHVKSNFFTIWQQVQHCCPIKMEGSDPLLIARCCLTENTFRQKAGPTFQCPASMPNVHPTLRRRYFGPRCPLLLTTKLLCTQTSARMPVWTYVGIGIHTPLRIDAQVDLSISTLVEMLGSKIEI